MEELDRLSDPIPVLDLAPVYHRRIPHDLKERPEGDNCAERIDYYVLNHPLYHHTATQVVVKGSIVATGASGGAAAGMIAGSCVPVVGTVIGGIAGALVGTVGGSLWMHYQCKNIEEAGFSPIPEDERQHRLAVDLVANLIREMERDEVMLSYKCPISYEPLLNPVFLPSGYTYNREQVNQNIKYQLGCANKLNVKLDQPLFTEDEVTYDDQGTPYKIDQVMPCPFWEVAKRGRVKFLLERDKESMDSARMYSIMERAIVMINAQKKSALAAYAAKGDRYAIERERAAEQGHDHWFTPRHERRWKDIEVELLTSDYSGPVSMALFGDLAIIQ